jgi:V/A-type H+-transporting ATPase subunit A
LLEVARYIREVFLSQYAYHEVDTYCSVQKMYDMMKAIRELNDIFYKALDAGKTIDEIETVEGREDFARAKFEEDYKKYLDEAVAKIKANLLGGEA